MPALGRWNYTMAKIRFTEPIDIIVQDPVTSTNEIGEAINDYQDVFTMEGEIQPLSSNSSRGIMGVTETSTHRLFAYPNAEIKALQRLVTADATYTIQYVQSWKTHKEAILEAG